MASPGAPRVSHFEFLRYVGAKDRLERRLKAKGHPLKQGVARVGTLPFSVRDIRYTKLEIGSLQNV